MPAILALPAFWGAVGAVGGGALALGAASETAGAQESAANTQANAVKYGADLQSKANADALAFQKQQAAQQLASQNAIQQANYNQWAAKEQRMSDFGAMLGLAPRNIPAYVPIPGLPSGSSSGTSASGGPSGATSSSAAGNFPTLAQGTNPTDTNAITDALKQNYAALGVSPSGRGSGPTDLAYYADQIAATGGLTQDNFNYWFGANGRIAKDLGGGGGGSTGTSSTNSFSNFINTPTLNAQYTPIAPIQTNFGGVMNG